MLNYQDSFDYIVKLGCTLKITPDYTHNDVLLLLSRCIDVSFCVRVDEVCLFTSSRDIDYVIVVGYEHRIVGYGVDKCECARIEIKTPTCLINSVREQTINESSRVLEYEYDNFIAQKQRKEKIEAMIEFAKL